ncbi:STAS domain-containing protein [bacterium]|jgi:anti-anti-sigma factor|nr:STAS domain-containing protein [bacterium]
MAVQKITKGTEVTLKVDGWLDTQASPELEKAVSELESNVESLVLDLEKLEYISSAGLRQIVAAHKKMNGKLTLRNVQPDIMSVLSMAGFDKRLHIEA